ncbi:MAG: Fe-S cluster protein [Methanomassiliicoccaceae archaeon]|jgi:uncharacterized Fe-S cluster-containing protein|nr:Fe-S cluster protein [Methanomassiliicoccaceae archaeon]
MWRPPGKDCGSCGSRTCDEFEMRLKEGRVRHKDCPFYEEDKIILSVAESAAYTGTDIVGQPYDFIISPLPGEPSARKIVLPFRPDMTERMNITQGDIVLGRPAGAGCPVQHVIKVIHSDLITGVITGHVVSPQFARTGNVKDVKEYHMLGFEGIASEKRKEPQFGKRHYFLPGSCMMHRAHTGLVSMLIEKPYGTQIRIEDIIIL